ncbi:diguanylate cyclase/phosphodiesterase (GGDEF & EAL domains) with PAS/PAC sensor(s) [hydrothermal vent metagenome]|uniref:Diguanylate cyclase/phosphodiesterase (GGDEF & EAL domains) with PAS/PAC sensor(S) n=1 Tax=hydrothermal vent metagenome TaxID=652676 RepID=A0A3B0RN08_9ZZZZ
MVKLLSNIQNRLVAKAALLFFVAVFFASAFVVSIGALSDHARAEDQAIHVAQALTLSSAAAAAGATQNQDLAALNNLYYNVGNEKGVAGIFAIDGMGNILSQSKINLLSNRLETDLVLAKKALVSDQLITEISSDRYQFSAPIHSDSGTVGALVISFFPSDIVPGLGSYLLRNIWKGLALVFVGLPLSMLVFERLFAPVKELIRATNCAASGDLTARADIRSSDEFGQLAGAINLLLERMKASMDRTRWLAYGDQLTRLANKTAFSERLRQLVDSGKAPGALFLIDLDGFKRLNDAYGQEAGDALLQATAKRLTQVTSAFSVKLGKAGTLPPPMLARLSADEFAVIAPGCVSAPLAQEMADAYLTAISHPLQATGQPVTLSARIGIAMYPHDASDSKTLLNNVNFAIDVAKENGGGTWQFFEPSMSQAAIRRITLQNEMRRALKNREFIVYYQPKISVRDGSIAACEALVRWQKAPGKILAPGAFIDVAEETGLINEIGDYVLEESCMAAARWAADGMPCSVAVNVSAVQFARDNFSQIVNRILKKTGLPHELLELELTESVAMTNPERLLEQVSPLRERGVRFAIDDFGTGHSSLAYLTRLPFDVFKIDQSFVREMTEDKHARVIVQTILAMAESLGYHTVAEGVETREHFAFLQLHCCDYVQGYYFSRPVPEDEFVILLQQDKIGQDRQHQRDEQLAAARVA